MPVDFFSLPQEIRDEIYRLLLVSEHALCPRKTAFDRRFTTGLFYVNKAISVDATSIFYGENSFEPDWGALGQATTFLQQIGTKNAAAIRHVHLHVPWDILISRVVFAHEHQMSDPIQYIRDSAAFETFCKLLVCFPNLRVVTLSIRDNMAARIKSGSDRLMSHFDTALKMTDSTLRSIPSLTRVEIQLSNQFCTESLRNALTELGWKIVSYNWAARLTDGRRQAEKRRQAEELATQEPEIVSDPAQESQQTRRFRPHSCIVQ